MSGVRSVRRSTRQTYDPLGIGQSNTPVPMPLVLHTNAPLTLAGVEGALFCPRADERE